MRGSLSLPQALSPKAGWVGAGPTRASHQFEEWGFGDTQPGPLLPGPRGWGLGLGRGPSWVLCLSLRVRMAT